MTNTDSDVWLELQQIHLIWTRSESLAERGEKRNFPKLVPSQALYKIPVTIDITELKLNYSLLNYLNDPAFFSSVFNVDEHIPAIPKSTTYISSFTFKIVLWILFHYNTLLWPEFNLISFIKYQNLNSKFYRDSEFKRIL